MATRACLIGYKRDYDPTETYKKTKRYQINTPLGIRNTYEVAIADGTSAEFLMTECFEKFEEVTSVIPPPGWTGVDRFRELQLCLDGDAKGECRAIIDHDYPTAQDKNAQGAFGTLKRDIITKLSDSTYPGDKVHTYLLTKVQYRRCKKGKDDGRTEEPTKYLARLQRIRKLGAEMHHNQGDPFMDDDEFRRMFWHSFPDVMKDWLEQDQNKDPFDVNDPMDADEIGDAMQRYWNLHLKRAKPTQDGGGGKKRDRNNDGGDGDGGNSRKKQRRNQRNQGGCGDGGGGDGGRQRENCPIKGHEKHRHDWDYCFLNPRNVAGGYDHEAARAFYHDKAKGPNAWYRDTYKAQFHDGQQGRGGGRGYQQGGRGNGGRGGPGRGRGGRFQGGRGRGRGGYNNHYNQGGGHGGNAHTNDYGDGEGYHYQQGGQGYGEHQGEGDEGYSYQQRGPFRNQQQQAPPGNHNASQGQGNPLGSYYFGPPRGRPQGAPSAPPSSYARRPGG